MSKIERFEDIDSWKAAREVAKMIYRISGRGSFSKDFALTNQIRRAAISILSNIAEGFERDGNREFLNFLSIAKGSCGEVRSQLYLALDQDYCDESEFNDINASLLEVSRLISGFMKYLSQTEMRGSKFR